MMEPMTETLTEFPMRRKCRQLASGCDGMPCGGGCGVDP